MAWARSTRPARQAAAETLAETSAATSVVATAVEEATSSMFRALSDLIKRLRAWAKRGSAATTSKEAAEARRKAEYDVWKHGP